MKIYSFYVFYISLFHFPATEVSVTVLPKLAKTNNRNKDFQWTYFTERIKPPQPK